MENLMGYIDASTLPPSKHIPSNTDPNKLITNINFEVLFQKDQLLLFWILSFLSKEVFSYVFLAWNHHTKYGLY